MDLQDYSQMDTEEVLQAFGTDKKGLSAARAEHLLHQLAPSKLYPSPGTWLDLTARHLYRDSFLVVLAAGLLATWYAGASHLAWLLAVVLVWQLVLSLRALIRSRRFLLYLEQTLQTTAVALRSGKRIQLDASQLAPGDVIALEAGTTIPADVRLISASRLVIDERALPGGLRNAKKSSKTGQNNIALFGSRVLSGEATGVVIACGKNTILGTHAGFTQHINHYAGSPAQPHVVRLRMTTAWLAPTLAVLFVVYALFSHVTLVDFCLLLATLAVAVVPASLPGLLTLGRQSANPSGSSILQCLQNDLAAKTALAVLSIIGQVTFQVPLAISALLLLAFDLFVQLFPLAVLSRSKMASSHYQQSELIPLAFALFAAALGYLNYLFFFARRGISPVNIDRHSHLYFTAITLTWLTLAFCQLLNILLVRSDAQAEFFTSYLWKNRKLVIAFGISLFCVLNIVYNPWLKESLHTGPLALGDWLSAVATGVIYLLAGLIQRQSRKHTRHALLRDHHPDHIRKHLEPRGV